MIRARTLVLFLLPVAACESSTESDRVPGVVAVESTPETDYWPVGFPEPFDVPVLAPAVVQAGETFEVDAHTVGGCQSSAGTDVRTSGRTVRIIPYDRRQDGICTLPVFLLNSHPVQLTFATPGPVTVQVVGRLSGPQLPTEFTRTVVIDVR
jgi:hypothetical protein